MGNSARNTSLLTISLQIPGDDRLNNYQNLFGFVELSMPHATRPISQPVSADIHQSPSSKKRSLKASPLESTSPLSATCKRNKTEKSSLVNAAAARALEETNALQPDSSSGVQSEAAELEEFLQCRLCRQVRSEMYQCGNWCGYCVCAGCHAQTPQCAICGTAVKATSSQALATIARTLHCYYNCIILHRENADDDTRSRSSDDNIGNSAQTNEAHTNETIK